MAKKCGLSSEEIKFAKTFAKKRIEEYTGDNYIEKFQEIVKGLISEEVDKKSQLTYYTIIALMPQYLYEAYQELGIGFNEIDGKLIEGLQNLSKAINEGDNIVVDNINALLNDDLDGFSMGGISSGPEAPPANKVKKGLKEEFIDHLSTSPFQTVSQSNEITRGEDANGRPITIVSQIPDPNESFYQNLIRSLSEIAFQSVLSTFENVTFQGHTGFKLRITTLRNLDEKHIKVKDETRSGNTLISIVTDNDGGVLYFDDEYQINKKTGKPVYTRLSLVKKERDGGAYKIRQRSYVRPDGSTLPSNPLISPRQLAKLDGIEDPTNAQIEEYENIQQEQLRQLYFLQNKVRAGKDFIVNITKATSGFIEIDYKKPIDANEINWEQSDISFDPVIYNSKSYDPVSARWPGTAYIRIPGMRRHAPFIAKNLSDESVNTILELIFNKELKLNGKPIRNTERVSILEDMLFMDFKNGVSVEITNNRLFLFFGPEKKRTKVDVEGLAEVSNIREKLEEFIKEKAFGEENTSKGKYFFPTNKNSVNVATINNNNITIKSVSINDFILNNSYTWLVPNENGDIIYSNAHFTYEFDIEQEEELSDVTKVKGETSEVQVWVPGVNVRQAKEAARKSNPKESGIYSMRPATGNVFTYKGVTVNAEINFGNPWTDNPNLLKFSPELILAEGATQEERLENAVANYENWIKKLDFLDVFPERRDFIREKIKEGYFDGERIIYFKTGYRSHADVIAEMTIDKTKLDSGSKTSQEKKNQVIKAIDELSDDEAVIMTKLLSIEVRDFDQEEESKMKPEGLWFGLGNSWSEWVQMEMPEMVRENAFVLEFDKSRMLIMSTPEELDAFTKKYSTDDGVTINWNEVAKEYGGIEIAPYIEERRLARNTSWYYGWDVASGAVWDVSVITNYTEISEYLKSKEAAPTAQAGVKPAEYTNHSGGANGADTYWDTIGSGFGMVNNKHYWTGKQTPRGNTQISEENFEEGRYESAKAAKRNFGYKYNTMKDSRLIRNWSQVKYSNAVFAVSTIVAKGEKIMPDQPKDTRVASSPAVTGGTGYAVGMAINNNKSVYVFNQTKGSYEVGWHAYDPNTNDFIKIDTPILTKNFAGIGSRKITEAGKQAIRDVYEKTFNEAPTAQEGQPTQTSEVEAKKVYHHTSVSPQDFDFGNFQRGKDQISQFGDGLNASTETNKFFTKRYGQPIEGEVNDKDFVEIDANLSESEIYDYLIGLGYKINTPQFKSGKYNAKSAKEEYDNTEPANDSPSVINLFNDFQQSNPEVKGVKVVNHIIGDSKVAPFYVIYDAKSFYGPGSLSKQPTQQTSKVGYNFNPTNVDEETREEYKKFVIDKLGNPLSIEFESTDEDSLYKFTFKDGTYIETPAKGKMLKYPKGASEKILELSKEDAKRRGSFGYGNKFLIGLDKLAEVQPTEPTKKEDEIDDTDNLEFPDDLFESAKKDIRTKLKRLGKNRKLEAARKWYVESGLNDLVPFEIAWGIVNSDAYATFTRYGVTLWEGSDYSDLYHEGWHVFSSFVLTPEEQDQLYNEFTSLEGTFTNYQGVVKRFADASKLDAEEFYAREFREYALEFGKFADIDEIVGDKVLGKRIVKNKFFRKIYQFLNWLFSGFKRISAGQRRSLIETMDAMELFHNKQVGVKKMYDRLRTLNLKNEIPIDIASVKLRKGFDRLNSNRIESFNENSQDEFSLQESVVVKNSMEAWFSDFITGVAEASDKEGNKKLNPNISIVGRYFSDPGKYLKFFYDRYLPNKLKTLRNEYIKAGNTESVNLIDKIRRNYSDYESSLKANTDDLFNGVIRFHLDNSIFVKDIDKKILDRGTYVDDYDALVTFDKSGFEISALDLADLEVTWLISSLHKYEGVDPVKNMLGVHELNDFSRTFAILISKLTGIEDRVEMEKELKKLEADYPMFGELLTKIGNSRSLDPSTWSLWTSFKLAFYLMNVPVFQLNLMETYEDGSNNVSHTVTYGRSSASYRVVEMDFRSGFTTATLDDNEYIISTEEGNQLDIQKILNDFPVSRLRSLAGKRAFLKAIGLPLTDNIEINTQLNSDRIKFEFLRGKLKAIAEADRVVRDITKDLKTSFEVLPNSKVISPSEATNVSTILEIEYKYSGRYKSGSVTTAVGTRTYEQGQHSALSIQIDSLNKATGFDQMMEEMPWMRHLNPLKNPDTRRSIWLNSLFEMDNFEKGRPKRKDAALFLRNLSGIQSIVDDKADYEFSVAAADSVRYDKMILDIYALLLGGAPATMTHSDKGMVYSMGVNKVQVQGLPSQQNSSLYVDTSDFLNIYDEDADSDGYMRAYSIYIDQLKSELEIMKLVRKGEAGVNVPGYTIKDSKGEIRGANYQLFQDILKDPLKKRLITEYMKKDDLEKVISDNIENIEKDLKEYFDKHIEDTYDYIEELLFISKELEASIVKELRNKKISLKDIVKITPEQLKKAIISSYFINYEIHNIESIRLVYGNAAQYNMAKEEKHKRNANVASTGRAFSLDQVSIDYINTLSRRYRSSVSEIYGASWNRRVFNGTFNSVVFEDYVFPQSLLYDHYFEALVDNYVKTRGLSIDEAKKKTTVVLKPYKDMEVGDGQGWITFDAYRIARILTSRWGPPQEQMYNDIIDGKIDDLAKVASFFPPLKYLMNGPLQAEGIPVIGQHKFSLMPLIPNLLENKNFEQLHIELEKNNADYALFKSGSKVSTITDESGEANQLYNINTLEDGREILEVIKDSRYVINTVYLQYMKDVLDISMKYKQSSIFSTQMRKIVEQGFVVNGVPIDYQSDNKDRKLNWDRLKVKGEQAMFDASPVYKKYKTYENLISDLIRVRKQDLLKEAGWTESELKSGKGNLESLISMVKNQLSIIEDLSENELDFIGVQLTNELKNDLSYSLVSDKLESMLISIANKSLIKQIVNGESLVQTSSALSEWTNATKQQLNEYGNDLDTYKRVKLKDGSWSETYEMEVKVSLQGNFKKLFNLTHTDGKKVAVRNKQGDIDQKESLKRLNELINNKKWRAKKENRKMITMVGVRIPVQGANSMEMMIIREFLPEKTGNIIIPPKEIVAKSGSDFDIDKLTIMMPGIVNTLKGPRIISSKMKTRKESTLLTKKAMFETELKEIRDEYRDIRSRRDISKEYKWSAEKQSRYIEILQQISTLERKWDELNNEKTFYSNKLIEISKWDVKNDGVVDTRSRGKYYKVYNLYIESEAAFLNVSSDLADLEEYKMAFIKENNQEIKDSIDAKQEAEMDKVKQKLDKVKIELYAKSSEAIETDILFAVKDLIADPINFVNLVTPNSTEQFTEIQEGEEKSHLERLREKSSYSPKRGTRGMLDKVSHTRIIEPIYNIEKHAQNAVGKATLGIGAVDNTFNTLLTRAGAYLNKKYVHGSATRRVAILMDHNFMPGTDNQVSLSDLYDYDRTNLISDTISQLINGWVDVAKEAWIFDINGNKILSPVLLLLIQAGVPIKQALNFIANPYVKDYVEEVYKTSSIFSRTNDDIGPVMFKKDYDLGQGYLRREGVDRRQIKRIAKSRMFYKMGLAGYASADAMKLISFNNIYDSILKGYDRKFSEKDLEQILDQDATPINSATLSAITDNKAAMAFFHYLELDDIASNFTNLKGTLNFDTKRSTSLIDYAIRQSEVDEFMESAENIISSPIRTNNESNVNIEIVGDTALTDLKILEKNIKESDITFFVTLNKSTKKMSALVAKAKKMKKDVLAISLEKSINPSAILDKINNLNLNRPVKINIIGDSERSLEKSPNPLKTDIESIKSFSKEFIEVIKGASIDFVLSAGESGFEQFINIEAADQGVNSKIVSNYKFTSILKDKVVTIREQSDFRLRFKNFTTDYYYDTGMTGNIFPMSIIASIIEDSPIADFDISKFQLSMWSKMFELKSNETLNKQIISWVKDPNVKAQMKVLYGEPEIYLQKFRNSIVASALIDSIKEVKYSEVNEYKSIRTVATPIDTADLPSKGIVIYRDEMQNLKMLIDRDFINAEYNSKRFVNESVDLTVNTFNNVDEYFHFVMERELIRAQLPVSKMKGLTLFTKLYEQNKTETEKDIKAAKRAYEQIITNMALYNIFNFYTLFQNPNFSYAKEIMRIKKEHPKLNNLDLVNNLNINASFKKKSKNKVKNLKFADARFTKNEVDTYFENMEVLINASDLKRTVFGKEDVSDNEIEYISTLFKVMPLFSIMQSGFNSKDVLSINRPMPSDSITYLFNKYKESIKSKIEDISYIWSFKDHFDAHSNNRSIRNRFIPALNYNVVTPLIPSDYLGSISEKIKVYKGSSMDFINYAEANPSKKFLIENILYANGKLKLNKKPVETPENVYVIDPKSIGEPSLEHYLSDDVLNELSSEELVIFDMEYGTKLDEKDANKRNEDLSNTFDYIYTKDVPGAQLTTQMLDKLSKERNFEVEALNVTITEEIDQVLENIINSCKT